MSATQFSLFDEPPPKRVADTSRDSLRELVEAGTVERRQRLVLEALRDYQGEPTARELHQWMHRRGAVSSDPNSIKPRVTEVKEAGLLEFGQKRKCRVTGKTVYTLRLTERGRLILKKA